MGKRKALQFAALFLFLAAVCVTTPAPDKPRGWAFVEPPPAPPAAPVTLDQFVRFRQRTPPGKAPGRYVFLPPGLGPSAESG